MSRQACGASGVCPWCGSKRTQLHGRQCGRRRGRCRDCRKAYSLDVEQPEPAEDSTYSEYPDLNYGTSRMWREIESRSANV